MTATRINQGVCFIGGAGHSGSTLLGLVLGGHTRCFYAGEAGKTRYLGDPRKPARKRHCKLCGPDCPVWGGFSVPPGIDLYEQISWKTGREFVVDSTKNVGWIADRTRELQDTGAAMHLVFLQRDGRAVLNSRVRKYPERSPDDLIEAWCGQVEKTRAMFASFRGPKRALRYEEFATEPERVVRELCAFLGWEFEAGMLAFERHEHHPLGGNNGTQYLVARAQGLSEEAPAAQLADRSREYYVDHAAAIRLDLRWRDELDPGILERFEAVAGDVNAEFAWKG